MIINVTIERSARRNVFRCYLFTYQKSFGLNRRRRRATIGQRIASKTINRLLNNGILNRRTETVRHFSYGRTSVISISIQYPEPVFLSLFDETVFDIRFRINKMMELTFFMRLEADDIN
jgi:hypothetical protein